MDATAVQALLDAIQNAATMQERQDRIIDTIGVVDDEVRKNAAAIAGKVDAVTGKGLSTNDYTAEDKAKVAGIEAGAQKTLLLNEQTTGAHVFLPFMTETTCVHMVFLATPTDASLGFYLGVYEGQLRGVYHTTCIARNGINVTASNNVGSIAIQDDNGNTITSFNIKVYA